MTKLIAILIVIVVLMCGWQLFQYWEKVEAQKENEQKLASRPISGEQLPGMPWTLEQSYQTAQHLGPTGVKNWLKAYGSTIQDPRKGWIELDYCVMVARDDTAEAKRVFAEVKERTPPSSPIWPRVKQLAKTYE